MMMKLPEAGDVIDGTYEIRSVLGTGGFGAVYLARQINMDRDVALKLLVASGPKFEEMVKRFRREVMAIRNLTHPNTIRVYDFRDNPEGLLYYTMEALKGRTLKEEVGEEGPFSPRRMKRVLRQVLKSLSEAHSHGLVHRDLKPANIMIVDMHGETDFVKVLDFGIAKMMADQGDENDPNGDQLTSAGILVGTLRYMAPEQISAEYLGPQTDLYALGLIAVEMLSGMNVFAGTGRWDVLRQQISDEPVPVARAIRESSLGPVIMKCLEKRYQNRFASADEVLRALDEIGDGEMEAEPLYCSDGRGGWIPRVRDEEGATREVRAPVEAADGFDHADTIVADISERIPVSTESDDRTLVTAEPSSMREPAEGGQKDSLHSAHTMELSSRRLAAGGGATRDLTESLSTGMEGSSGNSKKGLWIALVIAGLLASGAGGYLFLQSGGDGESEETLRAERASASEAEPPREASAAAVEEVREVPVAPPEREEVEEERQIHQVEVRTGSVRASVFVDESRQGRTPHRVSFEEAGVEVRLEASGYEDLEVRLDHSSPERLDLEMTRRAPLEPAPVEAPRATRQAPAAEEGAPARPRSGGWVDVESAEEAAPARGGSDWVDIPAAPEPEPEEEEIPLF